MGAGGDLGDVAEELRVGGGVVEVVVADQEAERLAAELAELLLVDLLEDGALVPGGAAELLEVLGQVLLGDVEDLDLQGLVGFGVVDEVGEAAPGGFELLEVLVVHDGVDLLGQLGVDGGDHRLDGAERVVGDEAGAGEGLGGEGVDGALDGLAGAVAFRLELLVEQRGEVAGGGLGRGGPAAAAGDSSAPDMVIPPRCWWAVVGLGAAARLLIRAGSCSSLATSSSAPVLPSM